MAVTIELYQNHNRTCIFYYIIFIYNRCLNNVGLSAIFSWNNTNDNYQCQISFSSKSLWKILKRKMQKYVMRENCASGSYNHDLHDESNMHCMVHTPNPLDTNWCIW